MNFADFMSPPGIIHHPDLQPIERMVAKRLWSLAGAYHAELQCHPVEVASYFGVEDARTAKRYFEVLREASLIEVVKNLSGGRLELVLTKDIWRIRPNSSDGQLLLNLHAPPPEFGGLTFLPRLLDPDELLGSDLPEWDKFIFWVEFWRGDVGQHEIELCCRQLTHEYDLDRSNLLKRLKRMCKCGFFEGAGEIAKATWRVTWTERIFSQRQLTALQHLAYASVEPARTYLELICPNLVVVPVAQREPQFLAGAQGRPQNVVPGAQWQPQSGRLVVPDAQNRGSDSLSGGIVVPVAQRQPHFEPTSTDRQPHAGVHDIINQIPLDGLSEDLGDVLRRVTERVDKIEHASGINLALGKGTQRNMVFCWAAIVETNLFTINGRTASITSERFAEILGEVRDAEIPGAVVTQRVKTELGCSTVRWADEAERIAKLIGYPLEKLKGICDPPQAEMSTVDLELLAEIRGERT